ncbi:MAG: NAD-dependent deacetylase [Gammaproteobacteria bacterium]|nr:NAD-dependent deacetylase [Gammaproteobacteria bacterium]NIM74131.1 NAD-dependent deacetylase [Gammaproteobacteria bacterium]NIN39014.1 NAD-dependent deacetylase [Gammaproteobacteria bacterium]NIO25907.1 NAD-dependent deacetylase [Gammaproteobacteria bacterium]NIO66538.1 NAD-dependent deacetylase [Gammaproteobacteria bacterium]
MGSLQTLLTESQRTVIFTGAGISTESGIPDFRSPQGIWSKSTPIYFQEFVASEQARREAWRRKIAVDRDMQGAEPNRGHRAVAALIQRNTVNCVITQNIDGLHQKSGVPEDRIVELHGNSTYAKCLDCGSRHELGPIVEKFVRDETLPVCNDCGGIVKTATVSFGQSMPQAAMQRAEAETLRCELFLAIGSSLVVYPAAGFPVLAKRAGARLVIINREPTDLDPLADLVLNEEIGTTLGEAVGVA